MIAIELSKQTDNVVTLKGHPAAMRGWNGGSPLLLFTVACLATALNYNNLSLGLQVLQIHVHMANT